MTTSAPPSLPDFKATRVIVEWQHDAPLFGCRFDPTGRYLFAGSADFSIVRCPVEGGTPVRLEGHRSWVRALGFSRDGATLFSGGYDGKLIFWPAAADRPEPLRTVDAHRGWVRTLAVHPNGQWVATGGNDRAVRLWSVADGSLVREFEGHGSHVYSAIFAPHGDLVSGELYGQIRHWNAESGKLIRQFDASELHAAFGDHSHYGGVLSLACSPDGKHLSATGLHRASNPNAGIQWPAMLLFDWSSGQLVRTQAAESIGRCIFHRGVYHASGLLVGGLGKHIAFWRSDAVEPLHFVELLGHVHDLDLHPDGLRIGTAHYTGDLRVSIMKGA
jgi:WD40 repeat protein